MHSGAVLYADYGKNTEKILKNYLGGREPSEDRILGLKEYFFKAYLTPVGCALAYQC